MSELIAELKGVFFAFSEDTRVLEGFDLKIRRKDKIALIGANGVGKSTLLLLMTGFLKGRGHVNLFGKPLDKKQIPEVRKRIGLLFDDPDDQLFMPTVEEDVAFGPLNLGMGAKETKTRVNDSLKAVGLEGFNSHPIHHLSRGRKKLAALASVLSMAPELLLLDEPSAFLDPKGKHNLYKILSQLDAAQLIATHDLEFAKKLCPTTAVMGKGRILFSGPTTEVLNNRDLLKEAELLYDF